MASRYYLDADVAATMYNIKPKGKTTGVLELWTADEFELWVDDARVEKKTNPYGFIPFVIFPKFVFLKVSNRGYPNLHYPFSIE